MATKLFGTERAFSDDYPYLVPLVWPTSGSTGIATNINIDVAIPVCTSTLNTALGRGATAVIDKDARTVEVFDLTDWISGKMTLTGAADGDITASCTVDYVRIYGAVTPDSPDEIVWRELKFSVETASIELLPDEVVPDMIMVVVRINPYGGTTGVLDKEDTYTVVIDDELEMNVYEFVETLPEGTQHETPNDVKIVL